MPSWIKALENIAGEAASAGARTAGDVMDWSSGVGKQAMGNIVYGGSKGLAAIPGTWLPGKESELEETVRAYERGFDGYEGGRAVWEERARGNEYLYGAFEALNPLDPINFATLPFIESRVLGLAGTKGTSYAGKEVLRGVLPDITDVGLLKGARATAAVQGQPWARAGYAGLDTLAQVYKKQAQAQELVGRGILYGPRKIGAGANRYIKLGERANFDLARNEAGRAFGDLFDSLRGKPGNRLKHQPVVSPHDSLPLQVAAPEADAALTRLARLKQRLGLGAQPMGIVPPEMAKPGTFLTEGIPTPAAAVGVQQGPMPLGPSMAGPTMGPEVKLGVGPMYDVRHKAAPHVTMAVLRDMATVVSYRVQEEFNAFADKPFGAIQFAYQGSRNVLKSLDDMWGLAYQPYWDAVFRIAREDAATGALATGAPVPFPGAKMTNYGSLPIGKMTDPNAILNRGVSKGSRTAPSLRGATAAQVAANIQLQGTGGEARSFMTPEIFDPRFVGPLDPESVGYFYNAGDLSNAPGAKKGPITPERFRQVVSSELEGPYGLKFGKMDETTGQFVPAKIGVRADMEEVWGGPVTDEEWDTIWKEATDTLYRNYLTAAQEVPNTLEQEARWALMPGATKTTTGEELNMTRAERMTKMLEQNEMIERTFKETVPGTGKGTGKRKQTRPVTRLVKRKKPAITRRSVFAGGPLGEFDSGEVANIIRAPGGADFIEHGNFARNPWQEPFYESEEVRALGIKPNRLGNLLTQVQQLNDFFAEGNQLVLESGTPYGLWYREGSAEVVKLSYHLIQQATAQLEEMWGPAIHDALFFQDIIAATSSATGVRTNVANFLAAVAEYKMTSDSTYLQKLGFTQPEIDQIPKLVQKQLQISKSQRANIEEAKLRKNRPTMPPVKGGGMKTNDYGNSFEYEMDRAMIADHPTLTQDVKDFVIEAMDAATSHMANDRWNGRMWGFRDTFDPMEYMFARYGTNRAAELLSEETGQIIPASVFQAATWARLKQLSGVSRARTEDSIGSIISQMLEDVRRKTGKEVIGVDDLIKFQLREKINQKMYGITPGGVGTFGGGRNKKIVSYIMKNAVKPSKVIDEDTGKPLVEGATFDILNPAATITGMDKVTGLAPLADDVQGYGVALAGLGNLDLTTLSNEELSGMIERMLGTYRNALEGFHGDQLKLGFWNGGKDGSSIELTAVIPDRERAMEIAAGMNQHAIWDYTAGDGIKIDVPDELFATLPQGMAPVKNSKDLESVLELIYGKPDEPISAGQARAKVTSPETVTNPLTGVREPVPLREGRGESPVGPQLAELGPSTDGMRPPSGGSPGAEAVGFAAPTPIPSWLLPKFHSIWQLGIDIADAYARTRMSKFFGEVQGQMGEQQAKMMEGLMPEDILGHAQNAAFPAGYDPNLSDKANRVLSTQFTQGDDTGKTWREVFTNYQERFERGLQVIRSRPSKLAVDASEATKMSLYGDKDAKWVVGELDRLGMDIDNANSWEAAFSDFQKRLGVEHEFDPEKMSKTKVVQTAWGQQALISPRYHASNVLGSWMQNMIAGYGMMSSFGPGKFAYWNMVKAALKGEGTDLTTGNMGVTKGAEIFKGWGYGRAPGEFVRSQATHGGVAGAEGKNALGKVVKRIAGPKLGALASKVVDLNTAFAGGWEVNIRTSLGSQLFDTEMRRNMVALQNKAMKIAQEEGIDLSRAINFTTGEGFAYNQAILDIPAIRQTLTEAGLKSGKAEEITRTFLNLRNNAMEKAIKEVNRVHFSYNYTNLDEFIGRIVPFHYWASRATKFYFEEAIRHPFYLYKYAQLREGMDRMSEDPGLSARSKGFLKIMDGPYGFSLLMNPESLFGVAKMFDLDHGTTPEGETFMGEMVRVAKQHGVGLFPWIDATLNYMGAYGDTFAPDPAGIRTRQLVGSTINYARAQLGMEPAPAPYESANVKLRAWVSDLASSLGPEWLTSPVSVKASEDGTVGRASLDDLITSRIMAEHPDLTNAEMIEILNDPDSPEYDKAYQQVASAGLLNQIFNFTFPTTFKVRENERDVTIAQVNEIRKAAEQAGVFPDEWVPSVADAEFLATYKNKTGKDFKPGDYSAAKLKRDLAVATPGTRNFIIQDHEYNSMGSDQAQALMRKATAIRNGEWTPPEFAGRALTPEEADAVADAWVARNDPSGEVARLQADRKLYRDTHPEYATFTDWRSQMFNLEFAYGPEGFMHYRDMVSQTNPNAARYFAQKREEIIRYNPGAGPAKILAELDEATTSVSTWLAVTGQEKSQYNALPLPTNGLDPGTQAVQYQQMQQMQRDGGSPPPANWMEVLQQYA